MKYKRLDSSELEALEKEFIHFLASAQITGSDWEKMKLNELSKAEELLDVFSDMVYEKVMNKIEFLEYRDNKSLNIFHFTTDKVQLLGIRVKENSKLDLMAEGVFDQWNVNDANAIHLVRSEKMYSKDRGEEVFELLQTGCLITDGKLYNLLQQF